MAEAFIVLVLVTSPGGGADPTWSAVTGSAQKAIGADAVVLAQAPAQPPSDAEALSLGERVHASAVVEVRWADPEQARALLHIHLPHAEAWVDKEIDFDLQDSPAERGRTLGFAFGSMISSTRGPPEATVHDDSPPDDVVPPTTPEKRPEQVPPIARPSKVAVDMNAIASAGLGGDAEGFGGSLGLRWYAVRPLALRLGAGIRAGTVPSAQASSLAVEGAAGLALRFFTTRGDRPFELGARADFLVIRHELTRTSSATTTRLSRWLSGADFVLEGVWSFTPGVAVVVAPGVEAAFGDTQVFAGKARLATIPVWRAVGEVGIRMTF
jgi:hypothetical protein